MTNASASRDAPGHARGGRADGGSAPDPAAAPRADGGGPLERPASQVAAGRILLLATLALLPVLAVAAFWLGQAAFFMLFAGILLAAVFDAAVRGLTEHLGFGRTAALTAVIGGTVLALAALVWFGGRTIVAQSGELYDALDRQADQVAGLLEMVRQGDGGGEEAGGSVGVTSGADAASGAGTDDATPIGVLQDLGRMWWGEDGGPASFAQSAFGALANSFIIFFIGVFLVIDPGLYKRGVTRLFPPGRRETADAALHRAGQTLRRWLVGKLLSMAMIFALTLAGLFLVGFPFALPLALLAGALAFVPNLGPLLTYVPIALVGLSSGTTTMLLGVGVYAVAQTVESYVFTPLVQKRMVSLPPALILFAQVLGALLFGLWGVALATPLAAVLREWIGTYYVRRGLEGDEAAGDPERDPM
jgi:predicted PurR-regulated permease PerM